LTIDVKRRAVKFPSERELAKGLEFGYIVMACGDGLPRQERLIRRRRCGLGRSATRSVSPVCSLYVRLESPACDGVAPASKSSMTWDLKESFGL
jgi:hypothetical protein